MQTGPKTSAGKMRSRRNSLKHGVTAKHCIDHEEMVVFKYYQQELIKEHGAKTTTELMYIDNIAHAFVKKQRVQKTEAAQWRIERELNANNLPKLVDLFDIDDPNDKQEILSRLFSNEEYRHGIPFQLINEILSHSPRNARSWQYILDNMPLTKSYILKEAQRRSIDIFELIVSKKEGRGSAQQLKILHYDQHGNLIDRELPPKDDEVLNSGFKLSDHDIDLYLRGLVTEGRPALIAENLKQSIHLINELSDSAMPSQQSQELINRYERQADKQIKDNLTMLLQLIERREKREKLIV